MAKLQSGGTGTHHGPKHSGIEVATAHHCDRLPAPHLGQTRDRNRSCPLCNTPILDAGPPHGQPHLGIGDGVTNP